MSNVALKVFSEKLNCEELEIFEETKKGKKSTYIEGIFAQADVVNGNGRNYPSKVLMPAVEYYIETRVNAKNALGELDHPPRFEVSSKEASHLITKLEIQGSNVYGKAKILDNTEIGEHVKALMGNGVELGVSTRGAGKAKKDKQKIEQMQLYIMSTVDIVMNPSAPDAYVKGVNENAEMFVESGMISRMTASQVKKADFSSSDFREALRMITADFENYKLIK